MAEKQVVIETGRLRLVPLEAEHADDVVGRFDDPAMSTYLGVNLSADGLARTMVANRLEYEGPNHVHVALSGTGVASTC